MSGIDLTDDGGRLSIYLLAAEEDREHCALLRKHLRPLTLHGRVPVRVLDDFSIPPGDDVEAHRAQLLEADVVLSLVTADFIDDDEIYRRNQQVIERYNRRETFLVSVLVRSCMWELTPLAEVPVLPSNRQPIANRRAWDNDDRAVTAVMQELYERIDEIVEVELRESAPPEVEAPEPVVTVTDAEPGASAATPSISSSEAPAATTEATWSVKVAEHEPVARDWRPTFYRRVMVRRLAAALIDFISGAIVVVLLLIPFGTTTDEDPQFVAAYVFTFLVMMPLLESTRRATPGKYVVGLQVTDRDGRSISFGRAFVRSVARFVVYYAFLLVVPLLLQIRRFRTTKKLFHDELTGTLISRR